MFWPSRPVLEQGFTDRRHARLTTKEQQMHCCAGSTIKQILFSQKETRTVEEWRRIREHNKCLPATPLIAWCLCSAANNIWNFSMMMMQNDLWTAVPRIHAEFDVDTSHTRFQVVVVPFKIAAGVSSAMLTPFLYVLSYTHYCIGTWQRAIAISQLIV